MTDTTSDIHPSAIIAPSVTIGAGCKIGPFCVLGDGVVLGNNVVLKSHVAIEGDTIIGDGTCIWPFASIGAQPQDLKFDGEASRLEIGANNTIREYVTMHPGTEGGGGVTRIGDGNLFMVLSHIGHDCQIGNNIVFANTAEIGGHVVIGDNAVIGALSGIHQFVRIGKGAMIGGGTAVVGDVIPFGSVVSSRGHLAGLNLVGLRRRNESKNQINHLRAAYKTLFSDDGTLAERAQAVSASYPDSPMVQDMVAFVLSASDRSISMPK